MLTQRTAQKRRTEVVTAQSVERQVRQLLANKVSGNQVGLWLLLPEHLRLGTWDLLRRWSGAQDSSQPPPRLALQLVHEAALCTCNLRCGRTLSQKGFELANGLPFVAADQTIHDLLEAHTIEEAQHLQIALGKLRLASGHFKGGLLAIDPHRMKSYTKRQMRRHRANAGSKPAKMSQCFFVLDAETAQPICLTIGSGARTATQATPELLRLAQQILCLDAAQHPRPLVMADEEHYSCELFEEMNPLPFDLLVPMKTTRHQLAHWQGLPEEQFQRQWAGYALHKSPYLFGQRQVPCVQIVQRTGEIEPQFKGFLSTADRDPVADLCTHFPKRWHVEEFFKFNQALGWQRAGTLNLHIRYGQMTMALIAQAVIHQLRQRLGEPYSRWDAAHLGKSVFSGLEGDIRVRKDTILVTYYNAPNAPLLRNHYADLPAKLQAENVDPRVPWLYNFKVDFRFK